MLAYLGYFSKSFTLALILWPLVAVVLTLPILAIMYHRDHRLYLSSAIAAYIAVLYAVGLLTFTLYPLPDDPSAFCATHHLGPQLDIMMFVQDIQTGGLYGVLQLLMNVVFFLPLGFMLMRWARWRFWIALPFSFGCSLFIETSQLTGFWGMFPCAYRQFDVDDLLTNTLGAVIGYGIAMLWTHYFPQRVHESHEHINRKPGLVHRAVAAAIDVIFILIGYMPLSLLAVYAFYAIMVPRADGTFSLGFIVVGTEVLDWLVRILALASFLVFELLIPVLRHGQTLGGSFTHMSIETQPRTGARRVWFYVIRTIILGYVFFTMFVLSNGYDALVLLVLLVVWVITKRMPWDFVPADPTSRNEISQSQDSDEQSDIEAAGIANTTTTATTTTLPNSNGI